MVGNDVPRQLVLAGGALPVRLTGSWTPGEPSGASDLGAVDFSVTAAYDALRRGDHDDLSAVIVCNDSQAHLRLFYLLRARAVGATIQLLDLPREDSAEARRFARHQFQALLRLCEDIGGRALTPYALAEVGEDLQQLEAAVERMRARRVEGSCSGSEALAGYRDATSLPPRSAIARIDARGGGAPGWVRVHATGSSHPDGTVYRILQERGVEVVSDDHDTGDRTLLGPAVAEGDVETVLDAVVTAHFERVGGSAVELAQVRAQLTADLAATAGVAAAVGIVRDVDEAPLWDLQDQRDELSRSGIPFHVLTHLQPHTLVERVHRLADEILEAAQ